MSITAVSADGVTHSFPDGTDTAVIGRVMKDYAASQTGAGNPSFSQDLQGGFHDLGTAISQGAHTLGGVLQRNNLPGGDIANSAGDFVQAHTPDAPPGVAPSSRLLGDIKNGTYSNIPSDLLHTAVRGAPTVAPIIAGGVLGGPAGAGAVAGLESAGPAAYQSAANNGRTEPNTADAARGALSGAASGAISTIIPGAGRIASPILRSAARIAAPGVAMGAADAANQAITSAGTAKGLTVDPDQVASSALQGAAVGAGGEALGAVGPALRGVSNRVMARGADVPSTPEGLQGLVAAADAVKAQQDANGMSLPKAANTVKGQLVTDLQAKAKLYAKLGLVDDYTLASLAQNINSAQRHNNGLMTDADGTPLVFDQIDQSSIPDAQKQDLKVRLGALDAVSTNSFLKNQTGPATKAGRVLGSLGGTVAGAALDGAGGMVMGGLAHKFTGAAGAKLGGVVDNILGTSTPPIMLQAIKARALLAKQGIPQPGLSFGSPDMPTTPAPAPVPMPAPAAPAPMPAAPAPAPSSGSFGSPASQYIAGFNPTITHDMVVNAARSAEAAGHVPPGTTSVVDNSPMGIDPTTAQAIRAHLPPEYQVGTGPSQAPSTGNQGYAVENSEQARTNARGYQNMAVEFVRANPDLANIAITIAQTKSTASKAALKNAYIAAHPEAIGRIPDWLVDQGKS